MGAGWVWGVEEAEDGERLLDELREARDEERAVVRRVHVDEDKRERLQFLNEL